jgi:hypothetical protein
MAKGGNYFLGRIVLSLKNDHETPVIVYCKGPDGMGSATYDCATTAGDVDGYELTDRELSWLESKRTQCEEWYNEHRKWDF